MMAPPDGSAELSSNKPKLAYFKAVRCVAIMVKLAMAAGFNYAWGKAIITLDDLQNDPSDIPLVAGAK